MRYRQTDRQIDRRTDRATTSHTNYKSIMILEWIIKVGFKSNSYKFYAAYDKCALILIML